ncbi:hypothetical protein YC2023_005155 [Brassica napus]
MELPSPSWDAGNKSSTPPSLISDPSGFRLLDWKVTFNWALRVYSVHRISGTLIQTPTSRAPPVPTERGDDAKPFAPMVVTGTLDDDGLGPVSWWEGSTSNENMKMMMIPEPNFNLQM